MIDAAALAAAIGARLEGDAGPIARVAALDAADATCLAGLFEARYRAAAAGCRAGLILTTPALRSSCPSETARLVCDDARAAWGKALRLLHPVARIAPPPIGVHPTAIIAPDAVLGAAVRVGPFVCVDALAEIGEGTALFAGAQIGARARLGAGCTVHHHAVVHADTHVGERVWIGAHAVLGSPGFGLDAAGRLPHVGAVRVGDGVSIGAQTCVDRGTVADTIIEADAHLDNLVQVGHNAFVGRGAVLCGQVGLAGGARVEAGAVIGGQAGVAGAARVGANARVAAQSGVTRRLPPDGTYSGHPAEANHARLKRIARLRQIAERTAEFDDR